MTLANGRRKRTLEGHQVPVDAADGLVGDDRFAVRIEPGCHINRLPLDGHIGSRVDVLDRLRNLGADAVALDEGNEVLAVAALLAVELGYFRGICTSSGLSAD